MASRGPVWWQIHALGLYPAAIASGYIGEGDRLEPHPAKIQEMQLFCSVAVEQKGKHYKLVMLAQKW